jgi:hypothetical protein
VDEFGKNLRGQCEDRALGFLVHIGLNRQSVTNRDGSAVLGGATRRGLTACA